MTTLSHTLAFDLGSHACRLAVINHHGNIIHIESMDIATQCPQPGHYEQDPGELLQACKALIKKLPANLIPHIKQAGMCTQRSSIVAWNRQTGEALSPIISWRDLRNAELINSLEDSNDEIKQISGLQLSAHYSASKIRWLIDQHADPIRQCELNGTLCISPIASYLLFHLLEKANCLIDHSNAQRTQLFDIQSLDWSNRLLDLFQLNSQLLPTCRPVIFSYGRLRDLDVNLTAVCGDQNAAFHGFPELPREDALINIGTGAFVLSHLPENKQPGRLLRSLVSSSASHVDFVSEGTVNGAAAALEKFIDDTNREQFFHKLDDSLKTLSPKAIYINTISGLGSPWWCSGGAAEFSSANNLNQNEKQVAVIESIVFLLCCNLDQLVSPAQCLHISGGLSRLTGLCQKLANLSQTKTIQYNDSETSLIGCARLASQLHNNAIEQHALLRTEFFPVTDDALRTRYQQFVGELKKRCSSN